MSGALPPNGGAVIRSIACRDVEVKVDLVAQLSPKVDLEAALDSGLNLTDALFAHTVAFPQMRQTDWVFSDQSFVPDGDLAIILQGERKGCQGISDLTAQLIVGDHIFWAGQVAVCDHLGELSPFFAADGRMQGECGCGEVLVDVDDFLLRNLQRL